MIALSIRQPWASLILFAGKTVENRTWATRYRGKFLLHAAQGMTRAEFEEGLMFARYRCGVSMDVLQSLDYPRGGIVGVADLVDCVTSSPSPWFVGKHGFVLQDCRPLPFFPWKGQLGFFEVPDDVVVTEISAAAREPTGDQLTLLA